MDKDSLEFVELKLKALDLIIEYGKASVSMVQRKLSIGYPLAGQIVDALQESGYVDEHLRPTVTRDDFDTMFKY